MPGVLEEAGGEPKEVAWKAGPGAQRAVVAHSKNVCGALPGVWWGIAQPF